MNIRSMLNLRNAVTVTTTTETSDGMGGLTTTTSSVVLTLASIWQNGSSSPFLSDKISRLSSHTLCYLPSEITFADTKNVVTYAGQSYKTVGHGDDVAQYGDVGVIGLERIS